MNTDGCLLSLRIWIVQPRMWLNSGPSTVALCWHGIWVTSRSFLKLILNIVCMLWFIWFPLITLKHNWSKLAGILFKGIGSAFVSILIEKREGKIAADWLASEALKQPPGYQQLLTCLPGHKIPKEEEIKGKPYCKWHEKWTHSTNNCVNFRNLIQDYLDKGLFRIADRPMGIETSPFAGAVEINMMSADLRKLSDPQKELEAAEHIPQESSPESVASHSPRPLPTTGLCSRCQLEISIHRGEKHLPFRKRMEWRPVVREPLAQERRMTTDSIALSTQLIEYSCVKQHKC